jgi:hypothetical protein
MAEQVNHPDYYGGDTTYEVIKVAEAWGFDADAYLFQVLKYIGRPGKGDYLTDLRKALFYLERKIARMEAAAEAQAAAESRAEADAAPRPASFSGTMKMSDENRRALFGGAVAGDWAGSGYSDSLTAVAASTITGGDPLAYTEHGTVAVWVAGLHMIGYANHDAKPGERVSILRWPSLGGGGSLNTVGHISGGGAGSSTVIHHPEAPPEFHQGDGGRQLPPEFNAGNGRVMDGPARGDIDD